MPQSLPAKHWSVLALSLTLAACHTGPHHSHDMAMLAPCGPTATLQTALSARLMRGIEPETSPLGRCVASAARQGSVPAALLLANVYGRAMTVVAASGAGAVASQPALNFDLFGRHIAWLHLAAERGDPAAQFLLAQETEGTLDRQMPDTTLAWYQTAAQNGSEPALAAIGTAFNQGRVRPEQLYGLKLWLAEQANPSPASRAMLRRLANPATNAHSP